MCCSRSEKGIVSDGFHGFINGQGIVHANPFVGVRYGIECERAIPEIPHPCKLRLEGRIDVVRIGTSVGGNEVEITPEPFPRDVGDVVVLLAFHWRLNVSLA